MQDPRDKVIDDHIRTLVESHYNLVHGVDRGGESKTRTALVLGHFPRLGAMIAKMAVGLTAATLPMEPVIIMSRRHPDDDRVAPLVIDALDSGLELLSEISISQRRLHGDVLVIDDPWGQSRGTLRSDLERTIDDLAIEAITGTGPRGPMLGWGSLGGGLGGAKRRPSRAGHGLRLAQRAHLADGACTYRPRGTKRARRRAQGKAYQALRRDFYRTLSNEGF